jgi:general secretion pathway protein D
MLPKATPEYAANEHFPAAAVEEGEDDLAADVASTECRGMPAAEAPANESRGDLPREMVREFLLDAVDQSWQVSTAIRGDIDFEDSAVETPLERKLRSLSIPKICFQDIPFRDAVDLLGELSERFDAETEKESGGQRGISIVILDAPPEEARVHMTLRQMSLDRVLQLLAQSVGFDCEADGDTVVLSSMEKNRGRLRTKFFPVPRATVLRMASLRRAPSGPKGKENGEQIAREEQLIGEFLQNAGVDFQGIPGSGLAFDGSGLIVTQTAHNLRRIGNILRRYAGAKQVEIETKFIEVQQGALDELQFRWSFANGRVKGASGRDSRDSIRNLSQAFSAQSGSTGDGTIVFGPNDFSPEITRTIPISNQPPAIPNGVNLGHGSVPIIDALGILSGAQVGFLLRALEQHAGSDLMSAPKLTVLSGKTAEIIVAQEFRYPEEYDAIQSSVGIGSSTNASTSAGVTITAGTPRNFKTRNIGVEMSVTPIVEADNRISLQLAPSVTEFEGFVEYGGSSIAVSGGATVSIPSGFFQPIFSTRRIRTEVTIDDGATVVMGGLTREEIKEVRDKIPLLGDLPVLGRLFRSKGQSSQKRNLLIFVTARLSDPGKATAVEGAIVREGQDNPSEQRCNRRN